MHHVRQPEILQNVVAKVVRVDFSLPLSPLFALQLFVLPLFTRLQGPKQNQLMPVLAHQKT